MKAIYLLTILFIFIPASAQIPNTALMTIVKAEDARAYDKSLEALINAPNPAVQLRAALAAGRIGNDAAVPALVALLEKEQSEQLRAMAAFAIGEIESIKAADAILKALRAETRVLTSVPNLTARLVEAAGKIAAANAKDEKAKAIGEAILDTLKTQEKLGSRRNRNVVLLALTAALRAKPTDADAAIAKFLTDPDARIRADAANALARLRSKNANEDLRTMLVRDTDPVARANAARALGAAEDKDAFDILLKAATDDTDSRVRVSAIRSLATLREARAAEPLLKRGEVLFDTYKKAKNPNFIPNEHSEFLEIATTLGRLLPNTRNERAVNLFREFGKLDQGHSPEVYIARIRVAPGRGDNDKPELVHWRQYRTLAQVVGEFSAIDPIDDEGKKMKADAPDVLRPLAKAFAEADPVAEAKTIMAGPDVLQAYARFKTADLAELLRTALLNKDVQIRATAANLLAELPASKENVDALKSAFTKACLTDKHENDAQLAILDVLYKLDRREAIPPIWTAINSRDYLIRKKAFEFLKEMQTDPTLANVIVEGALNPKKLQLSPHVSGSKLGQILNTQAAYNYAVSRKNSSVKALLTTEKGTFTIDFFPEDAPLTVDNFIKLARSGYFNGLEVHRVVPNFVMQDGDPRGDGNGGPGWSIRCEVNMLPYNRGSVGMALSGKDTGGSQWFVTHAPQPHLDGSYTVFGQVNEKDMKVVDNVVRGDKIVSVRIVEGNLRSKTQKTRK